jgi:anti-sigma factor RsiW
MTCHEVESQLDAYARGTLSDNDARAIEAHAGVCADCAARLEALPQPVGATFSPPLPQQIRLATLTAVAQRQRQRTQRRWLGGTLIAAAAAAAAAIVAVPRIANRTHTIPAAAVATRTDTAPPDASPAGRIAAARAMTEFNALDAAAQELQSALVATPNDAELRTLLAAVHSRRDELRRRVEAANT